MAASDGGIGKFALRCSATLTKQLFAVFRLFFFLFFAFNLIFRYGRQIVDDTFSLCFTVLLSSSAAVHDNFIVHSYAETLVSSGWLTRRSQQSIRLRNLL